MVAYLFILLFNLHPGVGKFNTPRNPAEVNQINNLKDSLLQNLDQLDLIIQKQVFDKCYATDSLFFDHNNQLILSTGHFGCRKNVTYYLSIFNAGNIVYYEQCSEGDGLPYNKRVIYGQNDEPIYGQHTDYQLHYMDRKVVDSTTEELAGLPLKATYNELRMKYEELFNLQKILFVSTPDSTYNDKLYINHTDQKMFDQWVFILDKDYYSRTK